MSVVTLAIKVCGIVFDSGFLTSDWTFIAGRWQTISAFATPRGGQADTKQAFLTGVAGTFGDSNSK